MTNIEIPEMDRKYKHFKGGEYRVINLPVDANFNDGRLAVEYTNLDEISKNPIGTIFVSSLERFCGYKVIEEDFTNYDGKKLMKGEKVKRFTKIE